MKYSLIKTIHKTAALLLSVLVLGLIYGCQEDELPTAGSFEDETPPVASFSYASGADYTIISFTNLSSEALSYSWDFGVAGANVHDSVLTAVDPVFTYPSIGEYDVTLTATDGLGAVSDTTITVVVEEGPYQPIILEAGFEGDGETGDARDPWEAEWSTVIQISSGPVASGDAAGKLPSSGDRVAYQEFVVEAESNYDISFVYTLTDAVAGSLTVEILDVDANGGTFETYEDTRDHVIGAVTVNDQEDSQVYSGGEVSFASGTSTLVAIMISNSVGVDARFDDFAIQIGNAGAIPPSAAFTYTQSESNFLEYTFENTSLNGFTYMWDLGDSTFSTDESLTYTYEEPGVYTVSLVATSEGGLSGEFSSTFEIHAPAEASFEVEENSSTEYTFTSTSTGIGISIEWEFGDGYGFSGDDPVSHTYTGAGFYTVTLTATSETGYESVATYTVAAGLPVVENGDLEDTCEGCGKSSWRPGVFSGGEGNVDSSDQPEPYSGSGDGSYQLYDGTDVEDNTRGAKIDGSKCAADDLGNASVGNTRFAYQEMTLDPNTEYYLEFSYDNADGDVVVGEILDGHFADGSDALAASLDGSSLVEVRGTVLNGVDDGNDWRTISGKFTTNGTGEVSIWMWAFGGKSYYDNIKILPAWLVEADEE